MRDGALVARLQDAYRLLRELREPLGATYVALGMDAHQESPLTGLNDSILAHSFSPVRERLDHVLWKHSLELAGCSVHELSSFPVLSAWWTADSPVVGEGHARTD